jgi:hypothetical protein
MVDRYGNTQRSMQGYYSQAHRDERQLDGGEGVEMQPGWTINGVSYREKPQGNVASGPVRANDVVTRPSGYVPYQSVFSLSGEHAYNPGARQYPQTRYDEVTSGRIAETPTDRLRAQQAWAPGLVQNPNRPVEMRVAGIDYTGHGMPPPQNQQHYSIVPGGANRGRPDYGYLGAPSGLWDGYANARNNNQGWGGGYGSGGGVYW